MAQRPIRETHPRLIPGSPAVKARNPLHPVLKIMRIQLLKGLLLIGRSHYAEHRQPLSLFGFPLPATVETTLCREVTPQEYTVSETLACDLARNAVLRQAEQDFGEIELLDLTMDTTTQEDSLTARFHLRFIANIAKSVPFGGLTGN